jgi:hypothetical protein
MLETKPILVHFTTENDTLLKITNSINKNAIKLIKIVQIILAKTLEIKLIKVNAKD